MYKDATMIVEVWSIMVKLRDATMMVINSRIYWLSYNVLLILSQTRLIDR